MYDRYCTTSTSVVLVLDTRLVLRLTEYVDIHIKLSCVVSCRWADMLVGGSFESFITFFLLINTMNVVSQPVRYIITCCTSTTIIML